jgi:hypothetical protein
MTMASLPLSMRRCPCCHHAGVVALVTMALLPLIRKGVVSLIAIVVDLVAMVSLSSSMRRHPHHHHNGIVALVQMAFLPLIRRHLCHCHNGNCCLCCDGISAVVKLACHQAGVVALVTMGSLLSLMCRLLCCLQAAVITLVAMVLPLSMSRHLCNPGIFAIVTITLLPSFQLHHFHCLAGVLALFMMVLLPLLMRRCLCHCHKGVITLVALAPSPTLHGCCCPCCVGVGVIILLTSLPSRCMGVVTIIAPALLPPSIWHVCAMECGHNYLRLLLYAN